jgi:hypothetical protein
MLKIIYLKKKKKYILDLFFFKNKLNFYFRICLSKIDEKNIIKFLQRIKKKDVLYLYSSEFFKECGLI